MLMIVLDFHFFFFYRKKLVVSFEFFLLKYLLYSNIFTQYFESTKMFKGKSINFFVFFILFERGDEEDNLHECWDAVSIRVTFTE